MTTAQVSVAPRAPRSPSVEAVIEHIRYWVPTIADVARVYEGKDEGGWLLSVEPHVAAACPVAIALKESGRFDISIAGETYEDRTLDRLDGLVHILDRIASGNVIQRRWISPATGVTQSVETIVSLGADGVWREGAEPVVASERHDRHFLPYRRT